MKVSIVPYTSQYKDGVLHCFQRNYEGMREKTLPELYQWAKPMFTYQWQNDIDINEYPYKYGVVLLDDDKVVGYLGFIYAKRIVQNKELVYCSGTTWAIDEGYRIYLFKAIKRAIVNADIIFDFTAIAPVKETLTKVFKFQTIKSTTREFFPVPSFSNRVYFQEIHKAEDIEDEIIRRMFSDHIAYPVKCIHITNRVKDCYLFYKREDRVKTKYFGRQACVIVLYVSNRDFYSRYAHEIVWKLQRREKAHLRCESIFFDEKILHYSLYAKHNWTQLVLDKSGMNVPIDYLYSEIAMLK